MGRVVLRARDNQHKGGVMEDQTKHWTKHEDIVALVVTVTFFGTAIYAAIDLFLLR